MKLGLHQSARLEQRMVQSPQMIQAMQILQLNGLDLEDRIQQEVLENPFLEPAERLGEAGDGTGAPEPLDPRIEARMEELERISSEIGPPSRSRAAAAEDSDRKLEAMANTPAGSKSLAESLIDELAILDLDERSRELAELLLYSLDERGWLPAPLSEVAADFAADFEPPPTAEELARVLGEVRTISHPALGAHDLRECLLLQLGPPDTRDPLLAAIVENHLPDVEQNRIPRIAKETGRSLEDVQEAIDLLRTLDPSPGSGYGGSQADVVVPDVLVEEVDGAWQVRLERERAERVRLSPHYKQMMAEARAGGGEGREWLKKRLESARWFLDAIEQRKNTLLAIAKAIFKHQEPFLREGLSALQPLRMQEIADLVGVHISTVSRAVSGKYAQTPRGIFPLKFFFAGGTANESGEVQSQVAIKQRVAEIVGAETGDRPLSDEEIAAALEREDGIKIARRTVTKYRKALGLPSSNQRRRYGS